MALHVGRLAAALKRGGTRSALDEDRAVCDPHLVDRQVGRHRAVDQLADPDDRLAGVALEDDARATLTRECPERRRRRQQAADDRRQRSHSRPWCPRRQARPAPGATADAFTLFERLEAKLEQYSGQLTRACVELAKDWRTDRYLRRLEAMMAVADREVSLVLTGTGDVLEPEAGLIGIGSGGNYALAAARALLDTDMDAEAIARKAMAIAADICVYTNGSLVVETLPSIAKR